MKELTIEEKAKRFDTMFIDAEDMYHDGLACSRPVKEVLSTLFPELKESEDERIRKALISHYQGDGCICFNKYRIDYKDIRAWLEKQGEQKPAEWSEEDEKYWYIVIAEFSKCAGKSVSKDEWMRCNDWLNSLRNKVQSQPKQEWSEEDEEILNLIIARLHSHPNVDLEEYVKLYNWLNSHRLQPKQKWSEEDAVMLNDCICAINAANEVDYSISEKERLTNFLKSLSSQTTWKPSDEQMEALWGVAEKHLESDNTYTIELIGKVLESLYHDLEKLRKE